MSITITDVAARAGVSKATVSRVLNGRTDVARETVERVRSVIEELGFVPSSTAVGLARGRTGTVGVLALGSPGAPQPLLGSQWMAEILQAVSDTLTSAGRRLRLFTRTGGERSPRRLASQLSAKQVDGLLVVEPEAALDSVMDITDGGSALPVVLMDDRDHRTALPTVTATNHEGGRSAAGHLVDLGRHRPLVITGSREFGCTRQRLDGFCEVYAEAGSPVAAERIVEGDFTVAGGAKAAWQALEDGMEFDAVFALNDLSAIGALQALRRASRRGAALDVALVGFDDIPLASHVGHPLTTVRQPLREMGDAAARMLLARLDEEALPEPGPAMATDLVVRRTAVRL